MDAYRAIVTKRDTRSYAPTPIPEDAVRRILQAGRMAGSAKNAQPLRVVAVREPARKEELAACGRYTPHLVHSALTVVLVLLPEEGEVGAPFAIYRGPFDAGRAAQNMMVAAWSEGITSCPITLHDGERAAKVLGLPEGHVVANAIAFGYPPGGRAAHPEPRPRLPLDAYVHWERW